MSFSPKASSTPLSEKECVTLATLSVDSGVLLTVGPFVMVSSSFTEDNRTVIPPEKDFGMADTDCSKPCKDVEKRAVGGDEDIA